jgi:hypothetical protein
METRNKDSSALKGPFPLPNTYADGISPRPIIDAPPPDIFYLTSHIVHSRLFPALDFQPSTLDHFRHSTFVWLLTLGPRPLSDARLSTLVRLMAPTLSRPSAGNVLGACRWDLVQDALAAQRIREDIRTRRTVFRPAGPLEAAHFDRALLSILLLR